MDYIIILISVLPLSYLINFCIFMSVCCFSNGAYLLVLVIEQILNSYSCRQWSLQFAAVFKLGIIQFLPKFIAICYIHFPKNQLMTKCYTASYFIAVESLSNCYAASCIFQLRDWIIFALPPLYFSWESEYFLVSLG